MNRQLKNGIMALSIFLISAFAFSIGLIHSCNEPITSQVAGGTDAHTSIRTCSNSVCTHTHTHSHARAHTHTHTHAHRYTPTDKLKRSFFQVAVVSILLYGCTTWRLTKRLEKKLDGNYTRMLRAILNKSWQQHPTRRQLYGHLPPITKTIQARQTRHAGHIWRCKDDIISDVLLWTPAYGQSKAGRPARTFIQQLCDDTGCNPEDLSEAKNDRETWRERIRDIRARRTT